MLVIEVFKHSSNDLNLVRLFVVSKFIGLYLLFLSDLDLPEPAVHSLFIPVVEMERSSKLLSSSVLSVFLPNSLPVWQTPRWRVVRFCWRVGFSRHFSCDHLCAFQRLSVGYDTDRNCVRCFYHE